MTKTLIFALMLVATPAYAQNYYYLIDQQGQVIDKQGSPYAHVTGLESRGEMQVVSTQDIPLKKAEYSNGVVSLHVNTIEEDTIEADEKKLKQEEKVIKKRMRKIAMESLKAEGYVFEQTQE